MAGKETPSENPKAGIWPGPEGVWTREGSGQEMFSFQTSHLGVPVVAQWLTNPTRNHKVAGSIPALAQWVKDPAWP